MTGLWAAVFGMVGTLIGGCVTYAANRLNVRQQAEQAARTRELHVLDRQYAAHFEFITRTDRFIEQAREFWWLLDELASADGEEQTAELDRVYRLYSEGWSNYFESVAAAEFAGPPALVPAVQELRTAVADHSNALDGWYEAKDRAKTRKSRADKCISNRDAVNEKRAHYIVSAQRLLDK
ncbi:hypothetical protein O4215_04190 [Rhodococcus maanshanensis]|uniref:hypothetical protein n=1 Tax=Rhodococcus maanshanensis TaxID=183556 RepID=UPI0022B4BAC0|nr:hypothetical protein [Rhodococcus maanshanensis]MCZ4554764.1 hypothetical protein [Rhodococcus maanshanensis]